MKAWLLGCAVMLSAGLARAQAPAVPAPPEQSKVGADPWDRGVTPEAWQAAQRAFEEARRNLDAGLLVKAEEKYREALKLWPYPVIDYELALVLIDLGQPVGAAEHLEAALAHGLEGLGGRPDVLENARRRYQELSTERLAYVEVSCREEGAEIWVDGKRVFTVERGRPSARWRVEAGQHTFVARKPGHTSVTRTPFIDAGKTFRIELELYTAEELTQHRRRWEGLTWEPWAALGGGALVGLAGGALQWSASSNYRRLEQRLEECESEGRSCDIDALRARGDTQRMLGIAGYAVAGAALVTGGVLLYLNRPIAYQLTPDEVEESKQRRRQPKSISIAPLARPGVGGAVVLGRF
jgi:hypothetical protein